MVDLDVLLGHLTGNNNNNNENIINSTVLASLGIRDLLRGGLAAKQALPSWITLLSKQATSARLHGVCALPLVQSTYGDDNTTITRDTAPAWLQQ